MIRPLTLFALTVALSGGFSVPGADAATGRANVIDGDTIEIRGERIRLFGVDAPESAQTCRNAAGAAYRCGQRAALALADRIGVQTVSCKALDRDRFGRTVSECSVGGENMNAWLVRNGWAVAYRRYGGGRYDADERAAKAAKAGIWAGAFVMPEAYRRAGRTPASGNRMNCTQLRAAGLALSDRLKRTPPPRRSRRHDACRVPKSPRGQKLYFRSVRLTGEVTGCCLLLLAGVAHPSEISNNKLVTNHNQRA